MNIFLDTKTLWAIGNKGEYGMKDVTIVLCMKTGLNALKITLTFIYLLSLFTKYMKKLSNINSYTHKSIYFLILSTIIIPYKQT